MKGAPVGMPTMLLLESLGLYLLPQFAVRGELQMGSFLPIGWGGSLKVPQILIDDDV